MFLDISRTWAGSWRHDGHVNTNGGSLSTMRQHAVWYDSWHQAHVSIERRRSFFPPYWQDGMQQVASVVVASPDAEAAPGAWLAGDGWALMVADVGAMSVAVFDDEMWFPCSV